MLHRLLAAALLAGSLSAFAAPPTDASLDELLRLSGQDQIALTYRATLETYAAARLDLIAKSRPFTDAQRERLSKARESVFRALLELVRWDVLRPSLLARYREKLTQEEVDQLVAMLQSPAWRLYTEKVVPVQADATGAVVQLAARLYPRVDEAINAALADLLDPRKGAL